MEGQRGMTVIFLFAPLGIIVGFVVGVVVALRARWPGFMGFVKAQGSSILITIALAAVVSGLCWLGADHPPKIDGKNLTLDFEVKIPAVIRFPPSSTMTMFAPVFTPIIATIAMRRSTSTQFRKRTDPPSFPEAPN